MRRTNPSSAQCRLRQFPRQCFRTLISSTEMTAAEKQSDTAQMMHSRKFNGFKVASYALLVLCFLSAPVFFIVSDAHLDGFSGRHATPAGGGIIEPQHLNPAIAFDPDSTAAQSTDSQSTGPVETSAGTMQYPLRPYSLVPFIAGIALLALIIKKRAGTGICSPASGGGSVSIGGSSQGTGTESVSVGNSSQSIGTDSASIASEASRFQVRRAQNLNSTTTNPVTGKAPTAEAQTNEHGTNVVDAAEAQSSSQPTLTPSPPSPGGMKEISPDKLIDLASMLSTVRARRLVDEPHFKSLHSSFQAFDQSETKWTVSLNDKRWHKKSGGKWIEAEPPPRLYMKAETLSNLENARILAQRH